MKTIWNLLVNMFDKIIFEHIAENYITIGNFAMCWGRGTPSSINSSNTITFPIEFASAPYGLASFCGDAKGNTYNQICVKNQTETSMQVHYYEAGGAVKQFNWLAVGFIGGGVRLNRIFRAFTPCRKVVGA